jgi:hypothetical protein
MILVPLFDLKFLNEFAATAVGTSNRRHQEDYPRPSRAVETFGQEFAKPLRRLASGAAKAVRAANGRPNPQIWR